MSLQTYPKLVISKGYHHKDTTGEYVTHYLYLRNQNLTIHDQKEPEVNAVGKVYTRIDHDVGKAVNLNLPHTQWTYRWLRGLFPEISISPQWDLHIILDDLADYGMLPQQQPKQQHITNT